MSYHIPVMLNQCIKGLVWEKEGFYIDMTYGGAGHSKAILEALGSKGNLLGVDQDSDAERNLLVDDRFAMAKCNFVFVDQYLKYYEQSQVHGVLYDLGVSSYHLNEASRGFSYRMDADLDMRMNTNNKINAIDVLNRFDEKELQLMFQNYGEVRNARSLANKIVIRRKLKKFDTTNDFVQFLKTVCIGDEQKYLSQVFQAIRIQINDEKNTFENSLKKICNLLVEHGRLVVLTYHSLEERWLKNTLSEIQSEQQKAYRLKRMGDKFYVADNEEQKNNPRSRSAKLRIYEKIIN